MWTCFQTKKLSLIALLLYPLWLLHWDIEALTFFRIFVCYWSSNNLSRCRCREASKLSRAQLCSYCYNLYGKVQILAPLGTTTTTTASWEIDGWKFSMFTCRESLRQRWCAAAAARIEWHSFSSFFTPEGGVGGQAVMLNTGRFSQENGAARDRFPPPSPPRKWRL